jgi:2,4-dienoyl-CoA reductase-like NADH-dependent reductase (Old Yellow Enzyme family)
MHHAVPRTFVGTASPDALFEPCTLGGGMRLRNRIVLAPCTRNRALPDLSPTPGAGAYYAERAEAGLLITEAVMVCREAQGYLDTPGVFLDSHVGAWAAVADAVHRAGGLIFMQLWHTGRMAHSHWTGVPPVAPSAVLDPILRRQAGGLTLYNEMPRAMSDQDIRQTIADYRAAAVRAGQAGFDGVEIHAANGYLAEQFLRRHTNRRTDAWGGSAANRSRFTLEVVAACCDALGAARVGLRLSPAAYFSEMKWSEGDNETYLYLLEQLRAATLAYLHCGIVEDDPVEYLGGTTGEFLRRHWNGVLVGNGGYTPDAANARVAAGAFDLMAFGKLFIANPDLVHRVRTGQQLKPYARELLDLLR